MKHGTVWQREHEGPHGNRGEYGSPGRYIIEDPGHGVPFQPDSYLLGRLAESSREQIRVSGILTPTREPDLPGPRIADTLGATDEQQRIGVGHQDQSHGRPDCVRLGGSNRLMQSQPGDEAVEQSASAGVSGRIRRSSLLHLPAGPSC